MNAADLGFTHRFIPAPEHGSSTTLLLLHGTGGDENDLLGLGRFLAPTAALLSPRGKVLERGMPRFFRRLAEGVFDLEDLQARTHELARFLDAATTAYGFDARRVVAVGFSNGANIAASLLLLHPAALAGALLFHPMVPLVPERQPDLTARSVFIGAGRADPLIAAAETERLAAMLRDDGADVTLQWQPGGHALSQAEADAARDWLTIRLAAMP